MPQILVHLDEATIQAIDRIAPGAKRKRADFIRKAVKDAIVQRQTERMREAYRVQSDSVDDADSWDAPENWKE